MTMVDKARVLLSRKYHVTPAGWRSLATATTRRRAHLRWCLVRWSAPVVSPTADVMWAHHVWVLRAVYYLAYLTGEAI